MLLLLLLFLLLCHVMFYFLLKQLLHAQAARLRVLAVRQAQCEDSVLHPFCHNGVSIDVGPEANLSPVHDVVGVIVGGCWFGCMFGLRHGMVVAAGVVDWSGSVGGLVRLRVIGSRSVLVSSIGVGGVVCVHGDVTRLG